MKHRLAVVLLVLIGAACGSGETGSETTQSVGAPDGTVVTTETTSPPAPSVDLSLDDGSRFVLADATRPTLFVFWAEW